MAKYINRLKVVLAEQHKTNLWLAKTLGKDPATVSKWCTNTAQPSLGTLHEIAKRLNVDIRTLLNATEDVLMACELSTPYGDHEGDTKLTFQLNKKIEWKTQARMTLAAKVDLTPENNLLLTPEEFGRRGQFYFGLSAFEGFEFTDAFTG